MNGLALCAGAAGLELGLAAALGERYRAVAYVEQSAEAACLLADHMEASLLAPAPIWDDVRTFDGIPWRGVVDIVTAGFPCQPFSVAGLRRGHEDERHLWPDIARIIGECQPGVVFLENVPGLLTTGTPDGRYAYEHVEGDLRALGFTVAAGIFSAAEVGAPHQRERLFILAYAAGGCLSDGRQELTGRPVQADVEQGSAELGHTRHDAGRAEQRQQHEVAPAFPRQAGGTVGDANGSGRWAQGNGSLAPEQPHQASRPMEWPPGYCTIWEQGIYHEPGECVACDGWRYAYSVRPDLAPAVEPGFRDVADGLARSMDGLPRVARLRILGNGVVPQTAARAFSTLWSELNEPADAG